MRTCKASTLSRCYLMILGPVYLSAFIGDVGASVFKFEISAIKNLDRENSFEFYKIIQLIKSCQRQLRYLQRPLNKILFLLELLRSY